MEGKPMINNGLLYFSFGSCMNYQDINRTVNDAERVGLGILENYELLFNIWAQKRQGGVANVSEKLGAKTFGSLWYVSENDLIKLDKREGHPEIYERSIVQINSEQLGEVSAITYIGKKFNLLGKEHYDPTDHYLELIREGLYETSNYDPSRTLIEEQEIENYLQKIESVSNYKVELKTMV